MVLAAGGEPEATDITDLDFATKQYIDLAKRNPLPGEAILADAYHRAEASLMGKITAANAGYGHPLQHLCIELAETGRRVMLALDKQKRAED